jgi:hypothetical protein
MCVAKIRVVKTFVSFIGHPPGTQLKDIKTFTTEKFVENREAGSNMLKLIATAFKIDVKKEYDMSSSKHIFTQFYQSWLGAKINGGKQSTVKGTKDKYQTYTVILDETFVQWFPKFNYDRQLAEIKNYSFPLTQQEQQDMEIEQFEEMGNDLTLLLPPFKRNIIS